MRSLISLIRDFFRALFSSDTLSSDACDTRYPIILIHGIAFRDDMVLSSWGSIPDLIKEKGGRVFLSNAEAWATYRENAKILATQVDKVLEQTGAEKVNLIAHSKGGIDARYAISKLGLGTKIASLTTVSTPHRGTTSADIMCGLVPNEDHLLYKLIDLYGKFLGDEAPDTVTAFQQLTREHMKAFNDEVKDVDGVYYQSYGSHMLSGLNDPLFALTHKILNKHEGANDGMVSEASYRWGEFQGVVEGKVAGIGISHLQITGASGSIISNINIPQLYAGWVRQLKDKGF